MAEPASTRAQTAVTLDLGVWLRRARRTGRRCAFALAGPHPSWPGAREHARHWTCSGTGCGGVAFVRRSLYLAFRDAAPGPGTPHPMTARRSDRAAVSRGSSTSWCRLLSSPWFAHSGVQMRAVSCCFSGAHCGHRRIASGSHSGTGLRRPALPRALSDAPRKPDFHSPGRKPELQRDGRPPVDYLYCLRPNSIAFSPTT